MEQRWHPWGVRVTFADCVLDTDTRELSRQGKPVAIEPQVLRVLEYLVANRERTVTRDDLLVAIWNGPYVSDAALTSRIRSAREAVGDNGRDQRVIKTLRGIGYRFVADASEQPEPSELLGWPDAAVGDLVGRESDFDEVNRLIDTREIVTLCGPGGVGKTALAMAVAANAAGAGHEVRVIDLSGLAPGADAEVIPRVAAELGVQPSPDMDHLGNVVRALSTMSRPVMVIDNAEHVIDGVRELLAEAVRTRSGVRFLVTSRRRLDLSTETTYIVSALKIEDAVTLFRGRADAVGAGTMPSREQSAALCERLDRLPLAVEVAAARVARSGLATTTGAIEDGRLDRLRGHHDAAERHESVAATVDWSLDLIDPDAHALLTRLSVFAGTFTLSAARDVCSGGEVPDHRVSAVLDELSEMSLVEPIPSDGDGDQRYRMLFTIRQRALSRLEGSQDGAAPWRARHASYYLERARQLHAEIESDACLHWGQWLRQEADNLRLAYREGIDLGDPSLYLGIVASIARESILQLRFDVLDWLDEAIELARPTARNSKDYLVAIAVASEATGLVGWPARQAELLEELAAAQHPLSEIPREAVFVRWLPQFFSGEFPVDEATQVFEECERLGRLDVGADILLTLAMIRNYQHGDLPAARQDAERLIEIVDAVPLTRSKGYARYALAETWLHDEPNLALALLDEAVDHARLLGHRLLEGVALVGLATAARNTGDNDGSRSHLIAAIEGFARQGSWQNQWVALRTAVETLAASGRTEAAVALNDALDHTAACPAVFGDQARRIKSALRNASGERAGAANLARYWPRERIVEHALAALTT